MNVVEQADGTIIVDHCPLNNSPCHLPRCLAYDCRYIYGLVDPRTGRLFYIGQTVDLKKRYRRHISNNQSNADRTELVGAILNDGLIPLLIVIDVVPSCEILTKNAEEQYIHAARKEGYIILCQEYDRVAFAHSFAERYGFAVSPFIADREWFLELAAMYKESMRR